MLSNRNIFIFLEVTFGTSNSEADKSLIEDFEGSDQRSKHIILIRSVLKFISYITYFLVVWAYFPKNFFLQSISYAAYAAYGFSDVALGDWNPLCSAKTYILVYECILRYEIERLLINPDSWVLKLAKRWFGHVKNTYGHSY